ncbi:MULTISPECIES: hypothetical protein [unclassified Bradyrhizobium]|uniref:hypothetical protein n=1 Tax=unclassified Bradyrhizobium TaxID=2631580 RepID=UPI001BA9A99D|nr:MULTISPECIES: hypothetical protein [unclassified Bradyrhizobium]WLA52396.1 hypothetical protein QIH80_21250 [Bradyrhizobium elkanii]MBR1206940.1 hypothetical protein [Bradyrhizobium sp. AUGA SZCCT0124]MBR1313479.1 hypothetical protein [Bradyrhizobium sp. AUGA SZCCT0051]MBR1343424.1 hypothetical protein [Bradyrhizobium sp. AUGA SZCCT0105]MBR1357156.1 hypothetical protein [Bradyrhizobium sp. AUGA SZCCT0045]
MNGLAFRISEQTAFEPQPPSNSPSAKPESDVVAYDLRARVGRTLEARRLHEAFAEALNPKDRDSLSVAESEVQQVSKRIRIQDAITGAFPLPRQPTPLSLQPLQEWEGYVSDVGNETFTARLLDVTAGGKYEDEAADFPISDLSETDLDLLKPGAVFRWVIGYQRQIGGTKRRVSQITFRRLPAWTKRDIAEASRRAESLAQSIEWD